MGIFQNLANPISGLIGGVGNVVSTWIQNKQQRKMQRQEFANNKEMWNLANQYNSPEMQMQRLEAAGLNKNLVYGSGSVVGNTSTQTPKYQAPNIQRMPLEQFNPLSILSQYHTIRQQNAQADISEENYKWQRLMNIAKLEDLQNTAEGKKLKNIGFEWLLNDPKSLPGTAKSSLWLQQHQQGVQRQLKDNMLRDVQLQFYDKIPKEFQWLAPLLMRLIN